MNISRRAIPPFTVGKRRLRTGTTTMLLDLANIGVPAHTGIVQPPFRSPSKSAPPGCVARIRLDNDHRYAKAARRCLTEWRSAVLRETAFGSEDAVSGARHPFLVAPFPGHT